LSDRKPSGSQLDAISPAADPFDISFDLERQDEFVTGLGVDFVHFKAMPSPIGMKDRGDYRQPDGPDTISSNGMIYTKSGIFTATMVDNSKRQKRTDSSPADESTSRLIMPRFYNKDDQLADGRRIYLAPGDRVYIADKEADDKVSNYQRMEYRPGEDNRAMFPIVKMESIIDSRGITYREGQDFEITCEGHLRWLPSGANPGIDPDTKEGRVYAVRYLYKAFWYVVAIPKEVRLTNTTDADGVRGPQRMAPHAVVQREYIFENVMNSKRGKNAPADAGNANTQDPKRKRAEPAQNENPNGTQVRVDMGDIENES
jgi:hypothetical protein